MAWTDERLDDAFGRIERNFDRVWDEFRETRTEVRDVRSEVRDVRTDMNASSRQLATIAWGMLGVLVAQLVAVVLAFA